MIEIVVPGRPVGAQRPRATRRGAHASVYTAPAHVEAEARIAVAARLAMAGRPPLEGPVTVEITSWHARPQARRRKRDALADAERYTGKPDADNVAKVALDALTKAGVWRDDAQVSDLHVYRRWMPLDSRSEHCGQERIVIVAYVCLDDTPPGGPDSRGETGAWRCSRG